MFLRREKGSALVITLVFSVTFAGLATFLLGRVQTEARIQGHRQNRTKALNICMGGIDAAMVLVSASAYNAGPFSDRNTVLYNADSLEDGVPGAFILDDGTYKVQVNNIGAMWYELISTSTVGEDTREIMLRVREKDFFSRYSLFAENGHVVVDDTNRWFGDVHVNREVRFRNRIIGTYAKFYGMVTSCERARDYAESGGVAETRNNGGFIGGEHFNMRDDGPPDALGRPYGWVELPPATELTKLGQVARDGATKQSFGGTYDEAVHGAVWLGPNGVSVEDGSATNMRTYITFSDSSANRRQMRIVLVEGTTTVVDETLTIPWEGVVHVEGDIDGISGDVNSRTTVVSETGHVNISDDICYVDDSGRPVYLYDETNPESEANFTLNPDYMKDEACQPRVLAIMAKKDIVFVNQDGDSTGDHDLCISAVLAAGIGGPASDGGVRWLNYGESSEGVSYSDPQRDLRMLGAMICDGASNGWAHFKGWSLPGGHGGYNNSVFFYDDNLKSNHPPYFLEIEIPLYTGLEITK